MKRYSEILFALLPLMCTSAYSQDPEPLPDHARLTKAETGIVKYFQQTPNGKCSWRRKVLHPNGDTIFDMKYDVAYHEDQVYWYERSTDPERTVSHQIYILNDKERMYWPPNHKTAALQIRPLSCFNGNPMVGAMMHPRYIGTGLEGVIGNLLEKSPRGIFADGGLSRIAAEDTTLDGQPVLKGTYKWDVWDVEMYFTKSEPTLLLKTVTSALSNTGMHHKTVTLSYKDWDCGVHYPSKIEFDYSIKNSTTLKEVVTVSEFDVLDQDEIKTHFTMAALNLPADRSVIVSDSTCQDIKRFHNDDGKLIPWTQKEIDDHMRNLALASMQAESSGQQASQPAEATPIVQSRPWVLYSVALILLSTCFATFVRLARHTDHA